jgi:hypothetical protein
VTEENKIVPLFKNFEQLHEEECVIYKEHYDAWHAAYRKWDLIKAALADDTAELNKLAAGDAEMALAKSEAARLKKQYRYHPDFYATADLVNTLKALVEKRDGRLFGLGAVAKRSMRFARAHASKNFGPGATSLAPAS